MACRRSRRSKLRGVEVEAQSLMGASTYLKEEAQVAQDASGTQTLHEYAFADQSKV